MSLLSKLDPDTAFDVLKKARLNGMGGRCGAAAVAINESLFGGDGEYYAAVNALIWKKLHKLVGHVAVKVDGVFWDAEGELPKDDLESWGMLDPDDPEYKDLMGGDWNDKAAYGVRVIKLSKSEVLRHLGSTSLQRFRKDLERARSKTVSGSVVTSKKTEKVAGEDFEKVKGQTMSVADLLKKGLSIKSVVGHLKPSKYPAPDIDPKTVTIDVSGDVHSKALLVWKDTKGRDQRAYTPEFHARTAAKKWERVKKLDAKFAKAVKAISVMVSNDDLPQRRRDAAAILLIIAETGLRPGSTVHYKRSGNRGVSTLSVENIDVRGSKVTLKFTGKSNKENHAVISNSVLADFLKSVKKGKKKADLVFSASEKDLGPVLKEAGLEGFTAKDIRTLIASKKGAEALASLEAPPPPLPEDKKKARALLRKKVKEASQKVADVLGNTAAVVQKSYLPPAIIEGYVKSVGGSMKMMASINVIQASDSAEDRARKILEHAKSITLPGHEDHVEETAIEDTEDEYDMPEDILGSLVKAKEVVVTDNGIRKEFVKRTRKYTDRGYEVREELWSTNDEDEPTTMKSAYSIPEGYYMGDPKTAHRLWKRYGITRWECHPGDNRPANERIVAVGYSPKKEKWFGWSHRAICGFGLGDKIFEEEFGDDKTLYTEHGKEDVKSLNDAFVAAHRFAKSVAMVVSASSLKPGKFSKSGMPFYDESGKEVEVHLRFDMEKLGEDGMKKLLEIERLLGEMGISCDHAAGMGEREWSFDWSLRGPVRVTFDRFLEDYGKDRYYWESPEGTAERNENNRKIDEKMKKGLPVEIPLSAATDLFEYAAPSLDALKELQAAFSEIDASGKHIKVLIHTPQYTEASPEFMEELKKQELPVLAENLWALTTEDPNVVVLDNSPMHPEYDYGDEVVVENPEPRDKDPRPKVIRKAAVDSVALSDSVQNELKDKSIVDLLEQISSMLNKIPGILNVSASTDAEVLPYNEHPAYIWFSAANKEALNLLMWAGCHRWWNWGIGLDVYADDGDPDRDGNTMRFVIKSRKCARESIHMLQVLCSGLQRFFDEFLMNNSKECMMAYVTTAHVSVEEKLELQKDIEEAVSDAIKSLEKASAHRAREYKYSELDHPRYKKTHPIEVLFLELVKKNEFAKDRVYEERYELARHLKEDIKFYRQTLALASKAPYPQEMRKRIFKKIERRENMMKVFDKTSQQYKRSASVVSAKYLNTKTAKCLHCDAFLTPHRVMENKKHIYPIGTLYTCECGRSRVWGNSVRNPTAFVSHATGKRKDYTHGFCNDLFCGFTFKPLRVIKTGIELEGYPTKADLYGNPGHKTNNNIAYWAEKEDREGDTKNLMNWYNRRVETVRRLDAYKPSGVDKQRAAEMLVKLSKMSQLREKDFDAHDLARVEDKGLVQVIGDKVFPTKFLLDSLKESKQ